MDENIRFVVAMRMARAALGFSQTELAAILGLSKITIARVETLESSLKAESYMRLIRSFEIIGVEIDLAQDSLHIHVRPDALDLAYKRLLEVEHRRSDRKNTAKKDLKALKDEYPVQLNDILELVKINKNL